MDENAATARTRSESWRLISGGRQLRRGARSGGSAGRETQVKDNANRGCDSGVLKYNGMGKEMGNPSCAGVSQNHSLVGDTGASANVFPSNPGNQSPYGITYPGSPTGRFSDGRLIIDYISAGLKFKYPEPYFVTINPDYRTGVNFAQAGSTALNTVFQNPIYFSYQLQQFLQFKQRLQSGYNSNRDAYRKSLPPLKFYQTFLYAVEIGGNDIINNIIYNNKSLSYIANITIPTAVAAIKSSLQTIFASPNPTAYDSYQCLIAFNNISQYFNSKLVDAVVSLRNQYTDAKFYIADMYNPYYKILQNSSAYGFTNIRDACCGTGAPYNYSPFQPCGTPGISSCLNPSTYISWDGVHYTQHYYQIVAEFFLSGTFLDPSTKIC
ncbi:GDSL esterase/lipase At3g62280 [Selaginella moellendorffii]|uniref:GDSL esterase/lipase At3g62280 n=1 Tax=Selaginella moellendorffii TaxID=88036 RepID=UPI000D1CCEF9|nr:GDSL esterase/lipase At3g62280 [Selaginella moellendorffii]|eukprot:XP_024536467.1 GDSL esterase/lipase At3g62280 [Selaginella moellendorffii]